MNLPLPSAPLPAASDAARYDPAAVASSRTDPHADRTAFAGLLKEAASSARTRPLQPPSWNSSSRPRTGDRQQTENASTDPDGQRAESTRRARQKAQQADTADASAQGTAGVAVQVSPASDEAIALPTQNAGSTFAAEDDPTQSAAKTAISLQQLPGLPGARHPSQESLPDGSSGPKSAGSLATAAAAADSVSNSTATSAEGFPGTGANLPSKTSLAQGMVTAAPVEPSKPQPGSQHLTTSDLSGSATANDSQLVASTTDASAAGVVGAAKDGAEKNAASAASQSRDPSAKAANSLPDSANDTRLKDGYQQVARQAHSVGIVSAQSSTDMRKPAANSPFGRLDQTPAAGISASAVISTALSSTPQAAPAIRTPAEPALVQASHATAAVEATLDAVERVNDTAHSSVELKLSFGDDTRLAVRVELRDGTVHTTFRTDSSELRQALASEWRQQAPTAVATSSDQSVKLADPTFTSSSGSPEFTGTSTGGHANSRQPADPVSTESSSSAANARQPPRTSPAASIPSGPRHLPTSTRLNAFA